MFVLRKDRCYEEEAPFQHYCALRGVKEWEKETTGGLRHQVIVTAVDLGMSISLLLIHSHWEAASPQKSELMGC